MEIKYDVFISYSRADRKVAEGICGYLEANGLRCFIDYRDIPRAAVWARVLPDAIRRSGMMVAVFSPNYNKSLQVERELSIADKAGIPVLPFRLADVPFEGMKSYYFESINWIDAFPDPEAVFGSLLDDIIAVKADTDDWTRGRKDSGKVSAAVYTDMAQSDLQHGNDEIDDEWEDDYQDGVDALRHMEYAEAFDYLIEPALANYRQSQLYISRLVHRDFIGLVPRVAWNRIRVKAEAGNAFAEYLMSRYHAFIEVDESQSYEYAARSARQGNIFGRYELAKVYDLGVGVERDDTLGVDKIKELERLDFAPAMHEMARQYILGFSIRKNPRRGLRILERGIELGIAECMLEMGRQKLYGTVVPPDIEGGRELIRQAFDDGLPVAFDDRIYSYLFDHVKGTISPDEASRRNAIELINEGIRHNVSGSMYLLALIYSNYADQLGMKKDPLVAEKWLKRGAELVNRTAISQLGMLYYLGQDPIAENNPEAWKYFKKSAALLDSTSIYYLGEMCRLNIAGDGQGPADCINYYENALFLGGWGAQGSAQKLYAIFAPEGFEKGFPSKPVERLDIPDCKRDEERALNYLRRGANYDNPTCLYILGCALTDTSRPYSNEFEGIEMLEKALNDVFPCYDAALRLHELYSKGIGVIADKEKAEEYLNIAKKNLDKDIYNAYDGSSSETPSESKGEELYEQACAYYKKCDSPRDLIKALDLYKQANRYSYPGAGDMADKVRRNLRRIYDYEISKPSPDFNLLAEIHFAPEFNDYPEDRYIDETWRSGSSTDLIETWSYLQEHVNNLNLGPLPAHGKNLKGAAAELSKLWKRALTRAKTDGIEILDLSPMDDMQMFDRAEEFLDTNSLWSEFLTSFDNAVITIQCIIYRARNIRDEA